MTDKNIQVYDVAIIGLGPAGALFASLLNNNLSVIAFDKKSNNNISFKKPCGGLLAPDAQKILSELGFELPSEILSKPKNCLLKALDLDSQLFRYYNNSYINIDRYKFDMWLKSKIPSYINVVDNSICTDIYYDGNYYNITVLFKGGKYRYRSKYLIGADGASSVVRNKLYPSKKISCYLAIQQWFESIDSPYYLCVFDSKVSNGYSWGIPKDGKFIFGGAYSLNKAKYKFNLIKEKLHCLGIELNNPVKTEACMILRPSDPFQFCCGKNNSFLIGEAAGFISPSSWDGITYALKSAVILSSIFNKCRQISSFEYQKAAVLIKIKLSLKMLKTFFIYNTFFRSLFLKSKIKNIK